MHTTKRSFIRQALAVTAAGLAYPLAARQASAQTHVPVEGTDFKRLSPPQNTDSPGKIEVLEFFSFACPHCYALENSIEPWRQRQAADVNFMRVPVPFLMNAETLTKSYYAYVAMGIADKMTGPTFEAIHVKHNYLNTIKDVAALVAANGGDAARFTATANSFGVSAKADQAGRLVSAFNVDSTPTLAIQGRFTVSPGAGGFPQMLATTDALIEQVRKSPNK